MTHPMTLTQMEDEAYEVGASLISIWAGFYLKVTDEGSWWFLDNRGEQLITRDEASELRDVFAYDA